MKFSPEQQSSAAAAGRGHGRDRDHAFSLIPAVGVVCPRCGARVGKPCVSTVPTFGVGSVGGPIDGVHVERVAYAREKGVA